MTAEKLDPVEGHETYYMHMKMPLILSNRSIVTTFYETTAEDGSIIVMHSSQGNEAIYEKLKDKIKKDVIAKIILVYTKAKFYEGGTEFFWISGVDVAGSIPDFVKSKIAK